jgi:hypothetical protein
MSYDEILKDWKVEYAYGKFSPNNAVKYFLYYIREMLGDVLNFEITYHKHSRAPALHIDVSHLSLPGARMRFFVMSDDRQINVSRSADLVRGDSINKMQLKLVGKQLLDGWHLRFQNIIKQLVLDEYKWWVSTYALTDVWDKAYIVETIDREDFCEELYRLALDIHMPPHIVVSKNNDSVKIVIEDDVYLFSPNTDDGVGTISVKFNGVKFYKLAPHIPTRLVEEIVPIKKLREIKLAQLT